MIEILKKYENTWRSFEIYMSRLYVRDQGLSASFGDSLELRCEHCERETTQDIPQQFLVGCLMEFLEQNGLFVKLALSDDLTSEMVPSFPVDGCVHWEGTKDQILEQAFEILEILEEVE